MTRGTEARASGIQKRLDLQELVKNATWRELLVELVESNSIDPWNVDITKITNEYIAAIRGMQMRDLHIPANMTLAASILLRMKSDSMIIFPQPPVEEADIIGVARVTPEVPELIPKFRMQPKRRVSLQELMGALDDAMKLTDRRGRLELERTAPLDFPIEVDDIDKKIDDAHKLIKSNLDREGITTYGTLARLFGSVPEAVFGIFIPMLFLADKGIVHLRQDDFFGEIFIRVAEAKAVEAVDS